MKNLLIIGCLFFGIGVQARVPFASCDTVAGRITEQLVLYPQEKIYVHSDKDCYMAGDTLWFRAHVTDAATHAPVAQSKYVYVEFRSNEIPASGEQPAAPLRLRILERDGIYAGYIPFPMTAKSGDYTLTAYTHFMCNLGSDYFFRKNIHVGAYGRRYDAAARQARAQTAYEVAFFPEGGYLVTGESCCVGFKALCADGTSTAVSGVVRDDTGLEVASFSSLHAGMGKFFFTPQAGRTYTAICTEAGTDKGRSFRLPVAREDVCILQLFPTTDRFAVDVVAPAGYDPSELLLLIHCRGAVCYYDAWKGRHSTFSRKDFPDGLLQLLLLDKAGNTLSERLVFCYNAKRQPVIAVTPDKPNYGRREKVSLTTEFRDAEGNPLMGSFSVAVTDNHMIDPYRPSDIRTSLLLESELRGYVEDPAYYFDAENPAQLAEVDALMLTQGWRRYDMPKVLRGEYAVPVHPLEIGQEIAGRVRKTGLFRKRNFKDYQLVMLAPTRGVMASAMVDSAGRFALNGFDLPDSTHYVLRAFGPDNKEDVELLIDDESFPDAGKPALSPDRTAGIDRYNQNLALFTDSLKNILLDEVVISAASRKVPATPHEVLALNSLDSKQIEHEKYNSLEEALRGKHGVSIRQGYVYVFGKPAAFMIDGMLWESLSSIEAPGGKLMTQTSGKTPTSTASNTQASVSRVSTTTNLMEGLADKIPVHIPMEMISRINIIAPVNTTLYGSRVGDRGLIYITTKTGAEMMSGKREDLDRLNIKTANPLGYQKPAEFYAPAYDTPQCKNARERDLRTTLYWNPDLRVADDGRAMIEFYTGDEGADYTLNFEGTVSDNKPVSSSNPVPAR